MYRHTCTGGWDTASSCWGTYPNVPHLGYTTGAVSKRAMKSMVRMINTITIVPSYTRKNSFVAIGIVAHAVHF